AHLVRRGVVVAGGRECGGAARGAALVPAGGGLLGGEPQPGRGGCERPLCRGPAGAGGPRAVGPRPAAGRGAARGVWWGERVGSPDGGANALATKVFEGSAMGSLIAARMASTAEMLACFDDAALVGAALRFERELAAALAEHGVIAPDAAAAIARACDSF